MLFCKKSRPIYNTRNIPSIYTKISVCSCILSFNVMLGIIRARARARAWALLMYLHYIITMMVLLLLPSTVLCT